MPPYVAGQTTLTGSGTSRSLTVTTATAAGDTLLFIMTTNSSSLTSSAVTDSKGNVYHLDVANATSPGLHVYRAAGVNGGPSGAPTVPLVAGATPDTVTITTAAIAATCPAQLIGIPSVMTTGNSDIIGTALRTSTAATTLNTTAITPSLDNELLLLINSNQTAGGAPSIPGFTTLAWAGTSNYISLSYSQLGAGTGGTSQNPVVTVGTAATGTTILISLLTRPIGVIQNDFENGTSGSAITAAGSGSATDQAFDYASAGTGATANSDNSRAHSGTLSGLFSTGSTSTTAMVGWGNALGGPNAIGAGGLYTRQYIYLPATTTANTRIITFYATAPTTTVRAYARVNTGNKLCLNTPDGVQQWVSTNALPVGAWIRVEVFVVGDPAAGQLAIRYFSGANLETNTPTEQSAVLTGLNTSGPIGGVGFAISAGSANMAPYSVDDVAASTAGWIGPIPAKAATLTDSFPGTSVDTTKWVAYNNATVSGGILSLTDVANSTTSAVVQSLYRYDLTGSSFFAQLASAGTQAASTQAMLKIQADNNNAAQFFVINNLLAAQVQYEGTWGAYVAPGSIAYSPTNHKWLRIRESGGTLYFDTSPDGSTWNNFVNTPNPFSLTSLILSIQEGAYATGDPVATSQWDNVNNQVATTWSLAGSASATSVANGSVVRPFTIYNNAAGGTQGTTVTNANSGGASGTALDALTIGTGDAITFDNTYVPVGGSPFDYKIVTGGTSNQAFAQWAASLQPPEPILYFRFCVYMPSTTATAMAANARFFSLGASGGSSGFIRFNLPSGTLTITDSAGAAFATTVNTFPQDHRFRIEGYMVGAGAGQGFFELKLFANATDTVPLETINGVANTRGAITQLQWGVNTNFAGWGPVWFGDLAVSNTGYIGPPSYSTTWTLAGSSSATSAASGTIGQGLVIGGSSSTASAGNGTTVGIDKIAGSSNTGSTANGTVAPPGMLYGNSVTASAASGTLLFKFAILSGLSASGTAGSGSVYLLALVSGLSATVAAGSGSVGRAYLVAGSSVTASAANGAIKPPVIVYGVSDTTLAMGGTGVFKQIMVGLSGTAFTTTVTFGQLIPKPITPIPLAGSSVPITVQWLDNTLTPQGLLPYTMLTATLNYNYVGSWSLTIPYSDAAWAMIRSGDFFIQVDWQGLFTFGGKCEAPGYDDSSVPAGSTSGGSSSGASGSGPSITLSGADWLGLIANRMAYPNPAAAWSAQTAAGADTIGPSPLETVIKHYVNLNAGPGALAARRLAALTIGTDSARGGSVKYSAKFIQNVSLQLMDIIRTLISASGTAMGVGVTYQAATKQLLFDVYIPRNLTSSAWFSKSLGNLTEIGLTIPDPTVTAALAQGASVFVEADATGISQFNRIETFVDSTSETDTTLVTQAATGALGGGAAGPTLLMTAADIPFLTFGRDYGLGDQVTVEVRPGVTYSDIVTSVTLTVDPTQQPMVTVLPVVGYSADPSLADTSYISQLAARIRYLEKRLNAH